MAMIFDLNVPASDLRKIGEFMSSAATMDVPEGLSDIGSKVLDVITQSSNGTGLWRIVVGNFVEYQPTGNSITTPSGLGMIPLMRTPDGVITIHADYMQVVRDGKIIDSIPGAVKENYTQPTGAYQLGVPF